MNNKAKQLNACRICGNKRHNKYFTVKEMMYGYRDEFSYFQCNNCECLQIEDIPEDMSKYYPANYYSFTEYDGKKFKGLSGYLNRMRYTSLLLGHRLKSSIMSFFSSKHHDILSGIDLCKDTKILDVGCGSGKKFLYPLAEIGFKNVKGCDPYLKETLFYKNSLKIENSSIYDMKGSWDIITYHHAFEHIPDPIDNLKKVYELLNPGGVCIIRIPVVSSFAWLHYGVDWVQLDAPRHFFLHSEKSMHLLGQKTNLKLYKINHDSSHFQFTGSEKYLKDIPLRTPKSKGIFKLITGKVKQYKFQRKAKKLNKNSQGDQAAFFFKKEQVS